MSKKPCIRCGRQIDAGARVCLFCNQDQKAPVPAVTDTPAPSRRQDGGVWGTKALVTAAVMVFLVATLAVGALVRGMTGGHSKSEHISTVQPVAVASSASTPEAPLVPSETTVANVVIQNPPNIAPSSETVATDATALPSQEYGRVIQQSTAAVQARPPITDPRTITAPREEQPSLLPAHEKLPPFQQSPAREGSRAAGRRTAPVPLTQPLPSFDQVRHGGTLRFNLLVGADGRVKEIGVVKSAEGLTADVISYVQKWTFTPATLDGEAVEGHFTVDVSFKER